MILLTGVFCFLLGMAAAVALIVWSCEGDGYQKYWADKDLYNKEAEDVRANESAP